MTAQSQVSTSNMSYQPIADMSFQGLHWIEASAGTGKTFTLSSLMVRIFLGAYLPNQVIATTFTRAAAAELKSRVRARLIETLRYFEGCQSLTEREIQAKIAVEQDPLFIKVLTDYAQRVGFAQERLKLVIDQLDELFVGTLDSFSQKLLREFSFESGKIERADITDDAQSYTQQLIHDVLREWIQAQPQPVVNYLLMSQQLKSVENFIPLVNDTLNFASASMVEVQSPNLKIDAFEKHLSYLAQINEQDIEKLSEYYLEDGQYFDLINKKAFSKGKFTKIFRESLPQVISSLKVYGKESFFSQSIQKNILEVQSIFLDSKGNYRETIFKKCDQSVVDGFYNDQLTKILYELVNAKLDLESQLKAYSTYVSYYLSSEVKKRLPQVLQQKSETTFAQQIRTLSEALQGEQGRRFAQFVQARYPLILVDEFQDTNQDQDDMLARIWRDVQRYHQGCMIMVGDPKQAIYGFRGGDMLTYNKARLDVLAKQGRQYSLKYNHRSVQKLVQVVDALFQCQQDFGEQVYYQPVEAGTRPHPALVDAQGENHVPLRWLLLEDKKNEAQQVAWKIRDLINQGIQQQLYVADDPPQFMGANDIAVLSKNHDGLDKVQFELERLGILVNRPSKRSVFESQVAKDVGALLTAMMHPFDEAKVRRALLSRLLAIDLKQLLELEKQANGLSQFMADFDDIRDMWINKGFLSAWQYALNLFKVWKNLVAYQSRDNERTVVNLRHLTELLSQHSEQFQGAQKLYHWYLKQLHLPAEREWELERKLSNATGVQLMTIHQSKGLEFKIVFLLGADKDFKEMNKTLNFSTLEQINPTTGQSELQRIVAVNDANLLDPAAIDQHNERAEAEQHRLWYVALTRASHRVYALLQDQEYKSNTALAFWRGQAGNLFEHPASGNEELLTEKPIRLQPAKQQEIIQLQALAFPEQRFYPRSKTSFSALAQHLSRKEAMDALAVLSEKVGSADDEINHPVLEDVELSQPLAWIKRQFPMGTTAGTFLHEIFEHIDFQDSGDWGLEIHRRFKNDSPLLWQELLGKYQNEFGQDDETQLVLWMQAWLADVLETPLHAGFQLKQLKADEHLAEFPFYLSLSDHVLAIKRIQALFQEYGIDLLDLNEANSARYLTGSIDLVYFDGQRYHIADYKSNFLGADQQSYNHDAIELNMSHASYWLQAGLYLVALHRYLKVNLLDYDIEEHLGQASYLYLRGMNGQPDQGVLSWRASPEFILRLDAILGHFAEDTSTENHVGKNSELSEISHS
ncbi:exodeoxyribonuclease V beta subunit [Acinetobacter johnsonii]|uniref:UvrD-helicase domain-containing protein n=1 Tax=Acinetobacter johnsonii TaxID=40214 RepID=UPI00160C355B|nr:UvrD-helicase domain-containing protein [Acinetobacter johnsonii]MBB4808578.1 exodeoxyribonuclease V beta subunit [Acinetobacter johnsonii]